MQIALKSNKKSKILTKLISTQKTEDLQHIPGDMSVRHFHTQQIKLKKSDFKNTVAGSNLQSPIQLTSSCVSKLLNQKSFDI